MKHPIQPLEKDKHGVLRFKSNAIITHLLDTGALNLNTLATLGFSKEDRQQLAQLIGYSLSGYGELRSYVDDEAYGMAAHMAEDNLDEKSARLAYLESELEAYRKLKEDLREPMAKLFVVDPSDLDGY